MFLNTGRCAQHTLKFQSSWVLLLAFGLGGCAQMQQAGYYNPPPASTTTDAVAQGEGIYNNQTLRAPNQIQIGLQQPGVQSRPAASPTPSPVVAAAQPVSANPALVAGTNVSTGASAVANSNAAPDAPPVLGADANAASAAGPTETLQAMLIPEPQSFAGTLPCFHPEMKCSAQRITITLAPNGRWRARAAYLEQTSKSGAVQTDQGCWRASSQAVPRVILLNNQGNVRAELAMTSGNALRLVSMNGAAANLTYNLTRQPDLDPIDELKGKPAPSCP